MLYIVYMDKKERKEFADSFDTYFTSATNAPSLEDDQWEILEVNGLCP